MESTTIELPPPTISAGCPAAPSSGRSLNLALFLFALIPAALIVRLISEYGVNVPFGDEWSMISLFAKWNDHQMTFADLYRQHNEHRIFFPKLIYIAFAQLTHWNLRGEMFFSVFLCAITSACSYGLLQRTVGGSARRRLLLWALCNVLIFSPAQYENWMWGFQLQMFLPTVCLVGALLLLQTPELSVTRFLGAVCLAVVATFSFGNGLLVWPVIGLSLLLRSAGKRWILCWAAGSLLVVSLYFVGYESHPHPGQHRALDYMVYFLRFNGNALGRLPVSWGFALAAFIGASGLLLYGGMVALFLQQRGPALKSAAPWIALAAYAVGSALIASHGRIYEGTTQALNSRYSSISIHLYIGLIALLAVAADLVLQNGGRSRLSQIAGSLAWPFMATLVVWFLVASPGAFVRTTQLSEACLHGMANLHFAKVIPPSGGLRRELAIHEEFPVFLQDLAILDRVQLLTPRLRRSNVLSDGAHRPDRHTGEFGRCDPAVPKSATAFELSGRAFWPALDQPAPCVVLAYESGGRWFGFALAEVNVERPDAVADLGEQYKYSGWRQIVDTTELPKETRQISAWSVDPLTGDVFKLPGLLLLPPS